MIIQPAVAGSFYPGNPEILRNDVAHMLTEASDKKALPLPKAIIAPHAGYIYSGPVAASAYACLANAKNKIKRVVVFAPSHRYMIDGVATTLARAYLTPLAEITIDHKAIKALTSPEVNVIEAAFTHEHALEVHLPFLQLTLGEFLLVPILVGSIETRELAKIIGELWGGEETLVVISSDLSHYHPYEVAKKLDNTTASAILALDPEGFSFDQACGAVSIKALLSVIAKKNLHVTKVDLRNSGDTAGSKDSVVGYGAFHFG